MTGWQYNSTLSKWVWWTEGEVLRTMSTDHVKECLKNLTSLHLVGSSHMRFIGDYLFEILNFLPQKHQDLSRGQIHFHWVEYAEDISRWFKRHTQKMETPKEVVVFMFGAWDLHERNLPHLLEVGAPAFIRILKKIKNHKVWKSARVIWMPTVSYPSWVPDKDSKPLIGRRNVYSILATNGWLKRELARIDDSVDMVDITSMLVPRHNEVVCGKHYLCRDPPRHHQAYRDVGLATVYRLVQHLCPTKTPSGLWGSGTRHCL